MRRSPFFAAVALASMTLAAPAVAGGKEWAKGVPFTTEWKDAIKQANATGRILLIYNGWEGENI